MRPRVLVQTDEFSAGLDRIETHIGRGIGPILLSQRPRMPRIPGRFQGRRIAPAGGIVQNPRTRFRVREQRLIIRVLHAHLMAQSGHSVRASLVEAVIARSAVEPLEEQLPTPLAKRQRKERLSHKVVRYGSHLGKFVEDFHRDLVAVQRGNVRVPRNARIQFVGTRVTYDVHDAHFGRQIPELHGFCQSVAQRQAFAHLHARALLVRQMSSQQGLDFGPHILERIAVCLRLALGRSGTRTLRQCGVEQFVQFLLLRLEVVKFAREFLIFGEVHRRRVLDVRETVVQGVDVLPSDVDYALDVAQFVPGK